MDITKLTQVELLALWAQERKKADQALANLQVIDQRLAQLEKEKAVDNGPEKV